jgi:microcystin-dependent protein
MSATANKNLALPANASLNWDTPLNNNADILDVALAGFQSINLATYSGNLLLTNTYPIVTTPLTSMSYLPLLITLNGALGGNTVIQWPSGITGQWTILNNTTGSYTVTLQQVGSIYTVVIPQGSVAMVAATGVGMLLVGGVPAAGSTASVGDLKPTAAQPAFFPPKWLPCYGQAVSRTTYSALFAVVGTAYGAGDGSTTFNVPNGNGSTFVGADNGAGVLPGWVIGTAGGEYQHTLTLYESPTHTHGDNGHVHYDNGHFHYDGGGASGTTTHYAGPGSIGFTIPSGYGANTATSSAVISNGYANLATAGSGGTHNNVQPSFAGTWLIYAGV